MPATITYRYNYELLITPRRKFPTIPLPENQPIPKITDQSVPSKTR